MLPRPSELMSDDAPPAQRTDWGQLLNVLILSLATAVGVGAFMYPFFTHPEQSNGMTMAHAQDAPFIFLIGMTICLITMIVNLETRRMNSKTTAVLGILVAINSVLRLVPGPLGFSAIFFLPILCGYVYGADFGFLLGTLSLFVSAIVTNGLGPWLPYQMFATGWMGMAAAWLPDLGRKPRLEQVILSLYGGALGLVFGAIMDLWFWPYLFDPGQSDIHWQAGYGTQTTLLHFALFYLTTSLLWDLGRAVGNVLLIALFGPPILRLLRRFKDRFHFERM